MAASSSGPPVASGNKRGAAYEDDRVFKRFKSGDDMDSMLDSALVPSANQVFYFETCFLILMLFKHWTLRQGMRTLSSTGGGVLISQVPNPNPCR